MSYRPRLKAVLLPALLLLASCAREAPPPAPARPVLTTVVGAVAAGRAVTLPGEVRSRIEQPLAFRVGGKIVERLVESGNVVAPGQLLARLDPVDTRLAADAAEAQRRLAVADLQRYRELRARNFVSQAAVDARETALAAGAAQADLARNQSAYTLLRAEQPGVVAQVLAEVGQVVAAGQPVVRVARVDTPEVAIAVPESRLQEIRTATRVEIGVWSAAGKTYVGKLRELAAVADPATRTYAARVAIVDPDANIAFGMSAHVRFVAAADAHIRIPQSALFQEAGKPAVWLVDGEATVSLRPVVVGRYVDDAVEIAAGLRNGERIVVAGVHKLASGEKIRVAERDAEGATVIRELR